MFPSRKVGFIRIFVDGVDGVASTRPRPGDAVRAELRRSRTGAAPPILPCVVTVLVLVGGALGGTHQRFMFASVLLELASAA